MITLTLLTELTIWRKRLEEKAATDGLNRLEEADLDFLNDRLPRFNAEQAA
jgi:hypothetical protein